MDESIYEKQHDPLIIQCLFAQRDKYNQAKIISWIYFFICGGLACFFLVLTSICNDDATKGLSICFLILSLFFKPLINMILFQLKTDAAKIQQYIDVYLYTRRNDSSAHYVWHSPYSKDEIIELVSNYPTNGFNDNDSWYEDYSSEPFHKQIVLCQKENIRWDRSLRKKFLITICCIIIVLVLSIVVFGVLLNHALLDTLVIVSWILPLVGLLIEYIKNIKEDEKCLAKLTDDAKSILQLDISESEGEWFKKERKLQDDIFEHRRSAFLSTASSRSQVRW